MILNIPSIPVLVVIGVISLIIIGTIIMFIMEYFKQKKKSSVESEKELKLVPPTEDELKQAILIELFSKKAPLDAVGVTINKQRAYLAKITMGPQKDYKMHNVVSIRTNMGHDVQIYHYRTLNNEVRLVAECDILDKTYKYYILNF